MTSKLIIPGFQSFISNFDIICLSETKLDQFDSVNINGFKFIFANRELARRKSGGVGVLIKNDLWPYIKVLDDKNENCL